MLNFIVCDDNKTITSKVSGIISKVMMPIDLDYRINKFEKYDLEFRKLMTSKIGKKVYILDIEVEETSGLDMARRIREKDWDSIIILVSAHYELSTQAYQNRLLILDFICKFNDFERKINDCLQTVLNILKHKTSLSFVIDNVMHEIDYNDVIYITRDEKKRKVVVCTYYKKFDINTTLMEIQKKLNNNFIKTHRACIVNRENIKSIDYNENKIVFKNNEETYLLSRSCKGEVKSLFK